jgi:hypothetical protein
MEIADHIKKAYIFGFSKERQTRRQLGELAALEWLTTEPVPAAELATFARRWDENTFDMIVTDCCTGAVAFIFGWQDNKESFFESAVGEDWIDECDADFLRGFCSQCAKFCDALNVQN